MHEKINDSCSALRTFKINFSQRNVYLPFLFPTKRREKEG